MKDKNVRIQKKEETILFVGLVCIDIVNITKSFPEEDTDQRLIGQKWQRGGNASNNCTVLAHMGVTCDFMGVVANSPEKQFILGDFSENNIGTNNVVFLDDCICPTAIVLMNQETGSRTILAYRHPDTRELTFDDFVSNIDLSLAKYKWIHFEVRPNVHHIKDMLDYIDRYNKSHCKKIITSIEMEKPRHGIDCLFDKADFIFISKDFAKLRGYKNKEETVSDCIQLCRKGATVICPWGEDGASAMTKDGMLSTSNIYPPPKVVDTLAAGDTFIASTIHKLSNNFSIEESITYGCKVAGAKVGMEGFKGVKTFRECEVL